MRSNKFEIPQKSIDYVLEEYPLFSEYTFEDFKWEGELLTKEINMNPYSLTLFVKTLFCKNSSAIFLSSFINLFGELPISTLKDPYRYSSYSHAMTLYILKMLEKKGIVKVIEYHLSDEWTDKEYHIESDNPHKRLKMYNIFFYKLRDIQKKDKDLLKKIERALHISKYQIRFKIHDRKLYTSLSHFEAIKCFFTGHIFTQFKKNMINWQTSQGFKDDIDMVLYSLKK